jgi:hypothetical protein
VEKSEINLTSTNSTISSSTSNSTNYLFNQDSFISSIPESRANDTTLVGNHHNQKGQQKRRDSNYSASTQLNTSTTVTTTLSSVTTADIQEKLTLSDNMDTNKDMMTRSSLSSSDLATSALASNINAMTAQLLLNNQNSKTCKEIFKT